VPCYRGGTTSGLGVNVARVRKRLRVHAR
jgi:hypothetical protein